MNKKVVLYLDFDSVLNNYKNSDRYDNIRMNKDNVSNLYNMLVKMEESKINYCIVINSSWKMNLGKDLIHILYKDLLKCSNIDYKIKYLFERFVDVTPTYHFNNFQQGENVYSCKSFEVESFIISKNLMEDKFLHIYLDDEIVDFKYCNVIQYNTDVENGFNEEDSLKLFEIIKNNIKMEEKHEI